MALYSVTTVEELDEKGNMIVEVDGRSIGIYSIKGKYYAIHNRCPHQAAQLCKGPVCGTTLESKVYQYVYGHEQEIVRCPWHGWEFSLKTGKSVFSENVRTRVYPVEVKEGQIYVSIGGQS
jgi:nitrite reductase (NADH) small subunit